MLYPVDNLVEGYTIIVTLEGIKVLCETNRDDVTHEKLRHIKPLEQNLKVAIFARQYSTYLFTYLTPCKQRKHKVSLLTLNRPLNRRQ